MFFFSAERREFIPEIRAITSPGAASDNPGGPFPYVEGLTVGHEAANIENMTENGSRAVCWMPLWNPARPHLGLEQLLLASRSARGAVMAFHEDGQPFCLRYQLAWEPTGLIRNADVQVDCVGGGRALGLRSDGAGRWQDGNGMHLSRLAGCQDVDIWPTPFTNSLPIWRSDLAIGERREFRVAWISAPDLTVRPQSQAYTRLAERVYRFESLDTGFHTELMVDEDGLVTDYPGYFTRVPV